MVLKAEMHLAITDQHYHEAKDIHDAANGEESRGCWGLVRNGDDWDSPIETEQQNDKYDEDRSIHFGEGAGTWEGEVFNHPTIPIAPMDDKIGVRCHRPVIEIVHAGQDEKRSGDFLNIHEVIHAEFHDSQQNDHEVLCTLSG